MIDRQLLIYMLKIGVPKTKIATHLTISKRTLYRYLQNNPIADEEAKVVEYCLMSSHDNKISQNDYNHDEPLKREMPSNWGEMTRDERKKYLDKIYTDGVSKILE